MNHEEQKEVLLADQKPNHHIMNFDYKDLESVGLPYAFFLKMLKQLACLLAIPCLAYLIHTLVIYFKSSEEWNFVEMLCSLVVDAFIRENLSKDEYLRSLKRKVLLELAISLIFLIGTIYFLMGGKQSLASIQDISKYTLFVSNIPVTETKESITKFFEESAFNINPANITLIPNYQSVMENKNKISSLEKKVQSLNSLISHNQFYTKSEKFQNHIHRNKSELEEEIKNLRDSMEKKKKENHEFSGKAFIVFQTHFMAEIISDTYNSWFGFNKNKFRNTQIHPIVEFAPNPDEIHTENLYFDFFGKKKRRIFIFFIQISLFCFMEFIIYYFDIYVHSISHGLFAESIFSIFVIVMGSVFSYILKKLVSKEKHISHAKKEFFEIILMFPFVLANIIGYEYWGYFKTVYTNEVPSEEELFEMRIKIVYVSVLISIIEPILKLLWTLVKRHIRSRSAHDHESIPIPPSIELSEKYMDITIILCVGIMGAPSCPGVLLITLLGILLNFWIFKYLVVYVARVEVIKDDMFVIFFLKMLVMSNIWFCVGAYFNARKLLAEHVEPELYMFIIFGIYGTEIVAILVFFFFHLERCFQIEDPLYKDIKERLHSGIVDPYGLVLEKFH